MPDITMCTNDKCPKRGECHRFIVTPNEYRQAYGHFNMIVTANGLMCPAFIKASPNEIKRYKLKDFLDE